MAKAKTDPFAASADLIRNAIGTARVFGENPRITRLVASTIGKFVIELEHAPEPLGSGAELLRHALAQIGEQDALFIPELHAALQGIAEKA